MPRLSRAFTPVVVEAVVILHGRGHQLVDVDTVEAQHVDVVVFGAAHVRHIDPFERPHAAMLTELVMRDRVLAAIVREIILPRQQAKILRQRIDQPQARLGADRAVALARAGADVERRFEANGATVATSLIGLQHEILSLDSKSVAAA